MENEKINATVIDEEALEKDFHQSVRPKIHNIGQITMVVMLIMMVLPAIVTYVFMGWRDIPISTYISFIAFWIPFMGIAQLFGHLRFYPMMGAANTYMAYCAGNAETMRVPVAQSCAAASDVDVLSARGQVVATIGVVVSVFANILVLLVIIFFGEAILAILPSFVRSALSYITYPIFGYLLITQCRTLGKGDFVKGISGSWMFIVLGIVCRYLYKVVLGQKQYILLTLATGVIVAFILEKVKEKKAASAQ